MTQEQNPHTLSEQLELFRENWGGCNCMVYDTEIVYKVSRGYSKAAALDAQILIDKLGLYLVALSTTFAALDSFVVRGNDKNIPDGENN